MSLFMSFASVWAWPAPGLFTTFYARHAGQVLAYSPDGKGYSVYPFGTRQSTWMHDLPILLSRGEV